MTPRLPLSLCICAALLPACRPSPAPTPGPPPEARAASPVENPLLMKRADYDFSQNPKLLARITATPHGYFRFVNAAFCRAVCARFADDVRTMPTLNLHGDAHVEQYAVTNLGRGLTDFDDSTAGPGLVDLLRFGTSLHLVCHQRGWSGRADALFAAFLDGYRHGLAHPQEEAPEPALAARVRAGFVRDRPKFLAWVESLMGPMPDDPRELLSGFSRYAEQVRKQQPELPEFFFELRKAGTLKQGVGSALDEKYLLRVEGPSRSPDDDVVLEAKEVRPPSGASCVNRTDVDPFRVMLAQSRLSYRPYRYLGYLRRGQRMLWVHEWMELYRQLAIEKALESADDLREVARDVGIQLGRGHPNQIAAPFESQVRQRQQTVLDELRPRLVEEVRRLTTQTIAAWEAFKGK